MKKKKKNALEHLNLENISASSANECTGLIPSGVQSKGELDSYKQLYDFEAEIKKD